jgi:hypothetical protein
VHDIPASPATLHGYLHPAATRHAAEGKPFDVSSAPPPPGLGTLSRAMARSMGRGGYGGAVEHEEGPPMQVADFSSPEQVSEVDGVLRPCLPQAQAQACASCTACLLCCCKGWCDPV